MSEDQQALWVYEVSTGASLRLTNEGNVSSLVWTPDGARLIFGRTVEGQRSLDWIPADRSGPVENVLQVSSDLQNNIFPSAVVDDGHALVFTRPLEGRQEIWKVQLEDEQTAAPLIEGEFRSSNAVISPDGQWLAYTSNQSGRSEVYVQPYPGPGPTVPVSIGGAGAAAWSADGSELFYRSGIRMMAADVVTEGDELSVGTPRALFEGAYSFAGQGGVRQFDVAPDSRFVMITFGATQPSDIGDAPPTQVVLVQNWFEELKERVPIP